MALVNTGNRKVLTLKKVVASGPHSGEALDVNNNLVADSGLSQQTKTNTFGDTGYIAPYPDASGCPPGE